MDVDILLKHTKNVTQRNLFLALRSRSNAVEWLWVTDKLTGIRAESSKALSDQGLKQNTHLVPIAKSR